MLWHDRQHVQTQERKPHGVAVTHPAGGNLPKSAFCPLCVTQLQLESQTTVQYADRYSTMAYVLSRVWEASSPKGLSGSILAHGNVGKTVRLFSQGQSTAGAVRSRPWTPEENQLLIDMHTEGESYVEIASSLPGRTLAAVHSQWRSIAPRSEDGRLLHYAGRLPRYTAAEDAILKAAFMKESGRTGLSGVFREAKKSLPMRTINSITKRYHRAIDSSNITWQRAQTKSGWRCTSSELSRIVQLKDLQRLTYKEIAAQLGRSPRSVRNFYHRATEGGLPTSHGDRLAAEDAKIIQLRNAKSPLKGFPPELQGRTLPSVKSRLRTLNQRHDLPFLLHRWTAEEDARLRRLCTNGKLRKEITAEFPQRSPASLFHRIHLLQKAGDIPTQSARTAARREGLVQLRDDQGASWADILNEFPGVPRATLTGNLSKARKIRAGKTESDRVPKATREIDGTVSKPNAASE